MREIHRLSKSPCILHGHGIWRIANLFPLIIGRETPARIVYSPRGTLSSWSMQYKSLVKKPFWKLLQKPALDRCHCYHATAGAEYEDIRRVGLRRPVAIIPNGIDIPTLTSDAQRRKQVVFLSRINPVKGLDILLPAWAAIAPDFQEWELIIAGPLDNEYATAVQASAGSLNCPSIKFVGESLGNNKTRLLAEAALFVLPSYSENFGIAVAEALAHGLPVITTSGTPWSEITQRDAGWYISPNKPALEDALRSALSQPLPALREMGNKGRTWMEVSYSWEHIAIMMQETYRWLHSNGSKPGWVFD
jgi:glycosyltransferase involved in cell wall biosynthesis